MIVFCMVTINFSYIFEFSQVSQNRGHSHKLFLHHTAKTVLVDSWQCVEYHFCYQVWTSLPSVFSNIISLTLILPVFLQHYNCHFIPFFNLCKCSKCGWTRFVIALFRAFVSGTCWALLSCSMYNCHCLCNLLFSKINLILFDLIMHSCGISHIFRSWRNSSKSIRLSLLRSAVVSALWMPAILSRLMFSLLSTLL